MRRIGRSAALAALAFVLGAGGLGAQTRVVAGFGGGIVSPTKGESSFGDGVKSLGYHLQAMVGIVPGSGSGKATFRFDAQYGSVNYEKLVTTAQPQVKIFTVNADLVLHAASNSGIRPYVLAGPTFGHFSYRSGVPGLGDESTSNLGFNGGAGFNIGRNERLWFFLEGRYIYTSHHKYLPLTAGVRINLKQGTR